MLPFLSCITILSSKQACKDYAELPVHIDCLALDRPFVYRVQICIVSSFKAGSTSLISIFKVVKPGNPAQSSIK